MAYNPRTDLLTPSIGPDTVGIGPGIAAGMSNFTQLVAQGIANKRQDQRDQKIWEQTLMRDEANYTRNYSMLDRREGMKEKKELASKAEEVDFASSAWSAIKAQMPEVITPEMDEKFTTGSLGTKRGLLVQGQAAFTRALQAAQDAEKAKRNSQPFADYIPGTGKVVYGRGPNVMGSVDAFANYGPAAEGSTPAKPFGNMWDGPPVDLEPGPTGPAYFSRIPDRPVKPSAQPPLAPNPATPAPPARSASGYYGR